MTTLKIKYCLENQEDKSLIYEYINQYNHCFRVAFNRLCDGVSPSHKSISELNHTELMDSWFIHSSIRDAEGLLKSNLSRQTDEEKKENKKVKVIFGGKNNFIKRCQSKISKEEFDNKRLVPLCSVGEKKSGTKSVHGNRKFKLTEDLKKVIFKTKEKKIILLLPNLKSTIKKQLIEVYKHQVLDDQPITYKVDLNYVYISFDEIILKEKESRKIENRVFSIDLNPNYVGWSVVDWKSSSEFNVVSSGVISIKSLNDKHFALKKSKKNPDGLSSDHSKRIHLNNKREYEVYEISKNLIDKALYYRCSLFAVEDLSIKSSDKKKGSKYNSLCNNLWNRNKMVNNLKKRCVIYGLKLFEVQPNYSSFIGNFLFRDLNLPDMVLASIEISRRCYEFYNQYVIKIKPQRKNIIQPEIQDFYERCTKSLEEFGVTGEFKDFKSLYDFFKNSKMMYRVSLDSMNLKFFSLKTTRSCVDQMISSC